MKFAPQLLLILSLLLMGPTPSPAAKVTKLPAPSYKGTVSVEEALKARRSTRRFASRSLESAQISQLLWAADGLNDPQGKRTAPSGRATYPIDIFLAVGERGVTGLAPGFYHYLVADHSLELIAKGDLRAKVAQACNNQAWIKEAPVVVVVTGEYKRSATKNGDQAVLFTHIEAGLVAQNFLLQSMALRLGAGTAGGFEAQKLAQALPLPKEHEPLLVLPVGYKH